MPGFGGFRPGLVACKVGLEPTSGARSASGRQPGRALPAGSASWPRALEGRTRLAAAAAVDRADLGFDRPAQTPSGCSANPGPRDAGHGLPGAGGEGRHGRASDGRGEIASDWQAPRRVPRRPGAEPRGAGRRRRRDACPITAGWPWRPKPPHLGGRPARAREGEAAEAARAPARNTRFPTAWKSGCTRRAQPHLPARLAHDRRTAARGPEMMEKLAPVQPRAWSRHVLRRTALSLSGLFAGGGSGAALDDLPGCRGPATRQQRFRRDEVEEIPGCRFLAGEQEFWPACTRCGCGAGAAEAPWTAKPMQRAGMREVAGLPRHACPSRGPARWVPWPQLARTADAAVRSVISSVSGR